MFTGLIESVGEVAEIRTLPSGARLRIVADLAQHLTPGESIAVNGVCLTAVLVDATEFHVDVSPETARVTTFGSLTRGRLVNLERPLRLDARLGGHFVQGHVDATAVIEEIRPEDEFSWVTVGYPAQLARYMVRRGSIALDGISLTIAGLDEKRCDMQIIPYTWAHTNLRQLQVRDVVNIECDIIGKYIARALDLARMPATSLDEQGA